MANNNPDVDTVVSSKASLVTDLNSSYMQKDSYSYARNAVRNSKEGDLGTIGNEPSNELCFSAPYPIAGTVTLPDDTILIMSGDGVNSEIGIGNPKDCSYTTVKNMSCLNFSVNNPVTGVAKKEFNKGIIITITDKRNPVRRIELKKLPSITSCDDLLLFKKIDQPIIEIDKGQVGNMPNGVYSVALAYVVDSKVYTDWFSITNRLQLFSETGNNSIDVKLDNLDSEFSEYSLVVVANYIDPVNKQATKVARIVGTYSTKVKSVSITDFINPTYTEILLSELTTKKTTWQKAGIISSNSNYLILGDLVAREEENYQLKAMQIESEYVIDQVEIDYYERDGLDVGYYADESYDFYIQGIYNTGDVTDRFHIPGPKARAEDLQIVSSLDVYEYDTEFKDCEDPGTIKRWQVENTAGEMVPYNNDFKCGRRQLGRGRIGFWQSTDLYPDNKEMFGDDANTPIRYHKFPDECKVPRYSIINSKTYINIKGVRFKNIPSFDNPDIIGYRIYRSDRKGGNGTIIARGIMTNMRYYVDSTINQEVMYSNYTVNDLGADQYLSSTQTSYKNGKEHNFNPLTNYYKDKFSFYSPHTLFEPRYSLGNEIKIESEEVADITGQFEIVHKHPKLKLLNQFAFWLALAIGSIETYFESQGLKNTFTTDSSGKITGFATLQGPAGGKLDFGGLTGPLGNTSTSSTGTTRGGGSALSITGTAVVNAINGLIQSITNPGDIARIRQYLNVIKNVISLITSLGAAAALTVLSTIKYAQEVLDIINNFMGYTDYVYQYNSHALFTKSVCQKTGNKRRRLKKAATYIPSTVVSIDDKIYNNFDREKCVYLELNKPIADPINKDNSRNTISGFDKCDSPSDKVSSKGSAFYVTNKAPNPNQYGRLGSASIVSLHSTVLNSEETPVLYGGDCIITRFQIQKKMPFFSQTLANSGYDDGVEYDYRLYRNIAYPRYWLDSTKYDYSELLNTRVVNFTRFSRTTTQKHNLDCIKDDKKSPTRIDDAYMYTSNNCVLDFVVECDYNINFREKGEEMHYSKNNTNLSQIFRSDRLSTPEGFKINRVYNDIYTTEVYSNQQREDFDPNDRIPTAQPNSIIYSLPSFNLQKVDNWQYFLPLNYFAFKESDFGTLTSIQKLDQDRIAYLFSKSSPYISMGRDLLQLEGTGRKITIGDGGLFAQDPREVMPTDNNYGSCNSRYAFSNTHLGKFYPSEKQGRVINVEGMDDITRQGISYWCKNYMPIFLYKYFPTYNEQENPIAGVGYLTSFDSFNETVYICKRDFSPKKEFSKDITWNGTSFLYKGTPISLRSSYFNDISWTISYSPIEKGFVSWHDWHPDWTIQTENHFMTVKGTGVWKHNEKFDSFCKFYGVDHPFEIEFVSTSGQQVETLRSIEYLLEVYKYKNFGRDRFHLHSENFDRLIIRNTEQISPLLWLTKGNPNPEENLQYPRRRSGDNVSYDVTFFKEENKYRVNQFWDTTKDRGEFTNAELHLFPTDESGYKNVINPIAIDINKPETERKKFRHYWNKLRLIKTICGENKFIVKILNIKKQSSSR